MILNETSYFGAGSRKVIAEEVAKRGYKKALVVTDKDLVKFGVAASGDRRTESRRAFRSKCSTK